MRSVLILRHGRTATNEQRIFTGSQDIPLSQGGREALLPLHGTYPQATAYFTSGMLRADQTLEILYGPVPRVAIPDLGEYRMGEFEGRTHDELFEASPHYRRWLAAEGEDVDCPGGESRNAFAARVRRGWQTLLAQDWQGMAVLVSHGGVIARLMGQIAPQGAPYQGTPNAQGWRVTLDDANDVAAWEAAP